MTTSEFIKMLKDADPEGTSHVRMYGGVPTFAHRIEGYYDGPYEYIDEEGKWHYTTKNSKVDICSKEREDMADDVLYAWNPYQDPEEDLWEKVKAKFVFELGYSIESQRKEREDNFLKPVKEHFEHMLAHRKKGKDEDLALVVGLYNRGCRFFRTKETKMPYHIGWTFTNEKNPGDIGHANQLHTYPILKSGKFIALDYDKDTYEYVMKF